MRGLRWQDSACGRTSVEGLMAQAAEPVPVPLGWRGPPGESPWTRLSIRAIWSPSRMAALQCAPDPPNPTVSGRRIGRWAMGDGRSPGSKGRCPSHVGSVEGRQGGGAPAGRTGKRWAARRLSQCGCSFLALASGRFRVSHSHRWLTKNVVLLRTPLSPSGFLGATARSGADAS